MNPLRGRRKIPWGLVVSVGLAACAPSLPPTAVVVSTREQSDVPSPNARASSNGAGELTEAEPGTAIPVTSADPAWGNPLAPVTMVIWGDYECRFTGRLVRETLPELQKHYGPERLRVVWRHNPLPFHKNARPAHIAAETVASVEAFRQKGDAGFWALATRLWEAQSSPLRFDRAAIERAAGEAGLDVAKVSVALDARTHWRTVVADSELAGRLHITDAPGFVVNDYFMDGAQSFNAFKRRIDEALGKHIPIDKNVLIADAHEPMALGATSPPPLFIPPSSSPVPSPSSPSIANLGELGAKHIVVMYAGSMRAPANVTRSRAEALARASAARKRLAAGARFEDMAGLYSDEPGAAQRGGDLGFFPRGAMVPLFQSALESIAVGQLSGVVETQFGFHIILRTR